MDARTRARTNTHLNARKSFTAFIVVCDGSPLHSLIYIFALRQYYYGFGV